MPISNYDITKEKMQLEFLKYNQTQMQQKFHLNADENYLSINFLGRAYRIDRRTGIVEGRKADSAEFLPADYYEVMSIYDVLCYSHADCHLAGNFCPVNSLPKISRFAAPGDGLFGKEAKKFDGKTALLAAACKNIGGMEEGKGDVAYRLMVFDFLPVLFQFWESDEDFSASFQILWDRNTLDYMHYETTYYVVNCLIKRLTEEMECIGFS